LPFLLGALFAATVLLFRHLMHETVGKDSKAPDAGSLRELARHPRSFLTVIALSAAGALCLYAFTTYMQKFLVNTTGMTVPVASRVMIVATVAFMLFQPAIGALSDRIGRRTCLLIFTGGMTLFAVPLLGALARVGSAGEALLLVLTILLILSFYTSVSGLFKAELFPSGVRALGVGLGHAIASAVFGGTAEYVALGLKQAGQEFVFGWYIAAVCGFAFLVAWRMPSGRLSRARAAR
jgi:MHS family alpha-ketoglutarate permease-like MFS transporter